MNAQLAILLAMFCFSLASMTAELFNPFELDPVKGFLGFSCKINSQSHEEIQHDCKDHGWVYQQIRHARHQKKYLVIHLEKLTQIVTNKSKMVYESDAIRNDVAISDRDLVFEYLFIAKKFIQPCRLMGDMLYENRCYLINQDGNYKKIWVTDAQDIFLMNLLNKKKIKKLKINLTALRRPRTYGEFLTPDEIIIPELLELN